VLVAYAAKDGTTALDGSGRNSPYTTALLRHLETPGLEINFLFRNVRDEVLSLTKREQEPFVYGSLSRQAVFLKAPLQPNDSGLPHAQAADEIAWNFVRESSDPAQLRRFIAEFPSSLRRKEAEERLAEAERQAATKAVKPAPKTCFTFNGQKVCN
jgi:hypothetical protein